MERSRERIKGFGKEHEDRPLRSIAMFNDALEDGLCDVNPFAKLGLDSTRARVARTSSC